MLSAPLLAQSPPENIVSAVNVANTEQPASDPAGLDYTDPANADQSDLSVEDRQYNITDILGPFADDTVALESETTVRQIAYMAQRFYNEPNAYHEQNIDFGLIASTTTDSFVRTAAESSAMWIAFYLEGPGRTTNVDESWTAYMNWILGINDGVSHWPAWGGGWSGTEASFLGYGGWYANRRKTDQSWVVSPQI